MGDAQPEGLDGFGRGGHRLRGWAVQGSAGTSEFVTLGAIAEKPVVTDAGEALREHVQQIAADELLRIEGHDFAAVAVGT